MKLSLEDLEVQSFITALSNVKMLSGFYVCK